MGCSGSAATDPRDGKVEIVLPVPNLPKEGGHAQVETPDGITLLFEVPAGYSSGTRVRARYVPLPKPKPTPKPRPKQEAKAKAKASAKAKTKSTPGHADGKAPAASDSQGQTSAQPASDTAGTPFVDAVDASDSLQSPPPPQRVEVTIVHEQEKGLPIVPAQLPIMGGGWDWIRHKNDDLHRSTRRDAAELLLEVFEKGGYSMQQDRGPMLQVKFAFLDKMRKGTRILSCGQGLPALPADPNRKLELEYGAAITPMEKCLSMTKAGFSIACVNAASAYHAGGGFASGGRHALEEAFCNQSTLYASLQRAQDLWRHGYEKGLYSNDWPGYHQHIPTDGCILSPHAEIFRGNTDQGYYVHSKTTPIAAVISMAMYNRNSRVRDAPVDAPQEPQKYEEGVRRKITASVHAAALSGADAIIIPDVGCGVFENDPSVCGRICGEVLFNYSSRFKRAVFTGKEEFYQAATAAMKTATTSGMPPVTADLSMRSCLAPLNTQAHLYAGNCVVCKRGLERSDFASLALLLDTTRMSHQMEFLHDSCAAAARSQFPKHQVMKLPDIASNAKSFLRALDLNGNGFVEKQELKCVCALLWRGDVAKETAAFEKDFEDRFAVWDADASGNLNKDQIQSNFKSPKNQAAAPQKKGKGSISLEATPETCIQWIQAQAKAQAASNVNM